MAECGVSLQILQTNDTNPDDQPQPNKEDGLMMTINRESFKAIVREQNRQHPEVVGAIMALYDLMLAIHELACFAANEATLGAMMTKIAMVINLTPLYAFKGILINHELPLLGQIARGPGINDPVGRAIFHGYLTTNPSMLLEFYAHPAVIIADKVIYEATGHCFIPHTND